MPDFPSKYFHQLFELIYFMRSGYPPMVVQTLVDPKATEKLVESITEQADLCEDSRVREKFGTRYV